MFCTPPATIEVRGSRHHGLGREVDGLLRRSALAVDGGAGHLVGHARDEPARARDVAGLGTDGVDAAEHDVVDRGRVDVDPIEQRADGVGAEIGGVHVGETAVALPDGRAHGVDDVGLVHGFMLKDRLGDPVSMMAVRRPCDRASTHARFM